MARKGDCKPRYPYGDPNDPQGMAVLCQAYLDWCQVHNYSSFTIVNDLRSLNIFIRWASERGITQPCEVTRPILERYQQWLFHYRKSNGDPIAFATQKGHLVAVRGWFKWLAKYHHILFNPASELELPRQCKKLPRNILTAHEAELVLAQPDVDDVLGLRDRAILETFYSTGMRRVELANLTIFDLDRERGTVMVQEGKGRKDRVIPIGDRALLWIDKYLQYARPKLLVSGRPTNVLFVTHFGEEFTLYRLSQLVQQYIAAADLGKKGSCHMFRHTMATLMLENGCNLRTIQLILGHASLSTTEVYTQIGVQKLVQMHRATHPARLERGRGSEGVVKADDDLQQP